jgi:hypothetical protein
MGTYEQISAQSKATIEDVRGEIQHRAVLPSFPIGYIRPARLLRSQGFLRLWCFRRVCGVCPVSLLDVVLEFLEHFPRVAAICHGLCKSCSDGIVLATKFRRRCTVGAAATGNPRPAGHAGLSDLIRSLVLRCSDGGGVELGFRVGTAMRTLTLLVDGVEDAGMSRTPKGRRSRYCPRLDADPGAEGAETSSRRSTSGAMKLSIVSTEVSLLKNREADCITVLVQCARASWPTYRTKGQLWGSRWCGRHDRRNRGSSAPSDACEPSRGRPLGCRRITRGVRMDGLRCVAVLRWDELRRNAR